VPAVIVIGFYGEEKTNDLLIASQVALSAQLGFAVWPLMRFTGSRAIMGEFANSPALRLAGWSATVLIIGLNGMLLVQLLRG
jgi:manganese transport protein